MSYGIVVMAAVEAEVTVELVIEVLLLQNQLK
jgi:hypothetical protein